MAYPYTTQESHFLLDTPSESRIHVNQEADTLILRQTAFIVHLGFKEKGDQVRRLIKEAARKKVYTQLDDSWTELK